MTARRPVVGDSRLVSIAVGNFTPDVRPGMLRQKAHLSTQLTSRLSSTTAIQFEFLTRAHCSNFCRFQRPRPDLSTNQHTA